MELDPGAMVYLVNRVIPERFRTKIVILQPIPPL